MQCAMLRTMRIESILGAAACSLLAACGPVIADPSAGTDGTTTTGTTIEPPVDTATRPWSRIDVHIGSGTDSEVNNDVNIAL